MSQIWPETKFVGMDAAAIQADLVPLAKMQKVLQAKRPDEKRDMDWIKANENIQWRIGDL